MLIANWSLDTVLSRIVILKLYKKIIGVTAITIFYNEQYVSVNAMTIYNLISTGWKKKIIILHITLHAYYFLLVIIV